MKHKDNISVIMSAYNSETSIFNSVKSILDQTYENLNLLVIDDFSNDKTFEILKEIAKSDERLNIYSNNKNIGLTKSLNKLIKISTGQYIARQDADDLSSKTRLEDQIKFLNNSNFHACTTRAVSLQNKNKKIPAISYYFPKKISMRYKNPFIHGSLMIQADVLRSVGGYDDNFKYAQDYKLFIDLIKKGYKIKTLNKTLYSLNTKNNISEIYKKEQKKYFDQAKKVYKNKLN